MPVWLHGRQPSYFLQIQTDISFTAPTGLFQIFPNNSHLGSFDGEVVSLFALYFTQLVPLFVDSLDMFAV